MRWSQRTPKQSPLETKFHSQKFSETQKPSHQHSVYRSITKHHLLRGSIRRRQLLLTADTHFAPKKMDGASISYWISLAKLKAELGGILLSSHLKCKNMPTHLSRLFRKVKQLTFWLSRPRNSQPQLNLKKTSVLKFRTKTAKFSRTLIKTVKCSKLFRKNRRELRMEIFEGTYMRLWYSPC